MTRDPADAAPADPYPGASAEADLLDGMLAASAYVTVLVDDRGVVRWVSDNVGQLFGFTPDELVGTNMLDRVDPEWNEFSISSIGYAFENPGQRLPMLFRMVARDGSFVMVEVVANNQLDNPAVGGLVVNVRQYDERVHLDRALDALAGGRPLTDVLAILVEVMGAETLLSVGAVLLDDGGGQPVQVVAAPGLDPVLCGPPELLGAALHADSPWGRAMQTGDPQFVEVDQLPVPLRAAATAAGLACCWCWPVGAPGDTRPPVCLVLWRRVGGAPEPSCELVAERLSRLASLALERTRAEARLVHAAHHDPLTGLANRTRFFDSLDAALAVEPQAPVGVLYLDLDGFKPVNDTHGHHVGDLVLRTVAERLRAAVRPGDLVARLGGDEFAILCVDVAADDAEAIAGRLVARVREPMMVGGLAVTVGVSVGVALAPSGGVSGDALVEAADGALYAVKADEKGGWEMVTP